jgi:hypothetical protein
MALCFLPRFQKRQLDKARQKKEEKAMERLEQELLQGNSPKSSRVGSGPQGAEPAFHTRSLGDLCGEVPVVSPRSTASGPASSVLTLGGGY